MCFGVLPVWARYCFGGERQLLNVAMDYFTNYTLSFKAGVFAVTPLFPLGCMGPCVYWHYWLNVTSSNVVIKSLIFLFTFCTCINFAFTLSNTGMGDIDRISNVGKAQPVIVE